MRIIQMIEALDYGDGVSNDALNLHLLLNELKIENQIFSLYHNEKMEPYRLFLDDYIPEAEDIILYHYSGKSGILERVLSYGVRVVMRYHNITPSSFFAKINPEIARSCQEGLTQIKANIHRFDLFIADSEFNAADLISYGAAPSRTKVIPIFLGLERLKSAETDFRTIAQMKRCRNILFVGRIAPNKCIEDILDVFEHYHLFYDRDACLYLVGNDSQNSEYTAQLHERLEQMWCADRVFFTGKVDDIHLYSYYKGADAFLCMSEHEGFCIPLLEAMCFDVPVIAYDAGAVSGTMGKSGILLRKKDTAINAAILSEVITNQYLRYRVLSAQREHLRQFYGRENAEKLIRVLLGVDKC